MKKLLLLLFICTSISSISQLDDHSLRAESAELTIENLQGSWKEHNKRDYSLAGDEEYETILMFDHFHVEGNKVWCFEYPIKAHWVGLIQVVQGKILITNRKYFSRNKTWTPQPPRFGVSSPDCNFILSKNKQTLCFGGSSYSKDSLEQQVINKLKTGKFNRECLFGKWKLKTFYNSGYDGLGDVDLIYPWKLPSYLNITKESVHRFYGGGLFYVKVNGEKKAFKISVIHVSEWTSELLIRPNGWSTFDPDKYENEDFIGYRTDEVRYMINDPDDAYHSD